MRNGEPSQKPPTLVFKAHEILHGPPPIAQLASDDATQLYADSDSDS